MIVLAQVMRGCRTGLRKKAVLKPQQSLKLGEGGIAREQPEGRHRPPMGSLFPIKLCVSGYLQFSLTASLMS